MGKPAGPRTRRRVSPAGEGLGIDAWGFPVVDPTENVLALVQAAVQRQDDLRHADHTFIFAMLDRQYVHLQETMQIRATYDDKLRTQEAARIDAMRALDVANVQRAAEVVTTQNATLATQVTATAEAMRSQVAATNAAWQANLATALEPIQTAINDLRKAQYEQQGQKSAASEDKNTNQWVFMAVIAVVVLAAQVALHFMK